MSLCMIEMVPDMPALTRFLHVQGLATGDEDLGYGIHAWLAAAFGDRAPKPWRLLSARSRPARILAYAPHDVDLLRDRLREFADPAVYAVCSDASLSGKRMPDWRSGRRLGFEVQCCPVGRESRTGVEKDLALMRYEADAQGENRFQVYCAWARTRLQSGGAATVSRLEVDGFRLVSQRRRARGTAGRRLTTLIRPQVLLSGVLTVEDEAAFSRLLATGIGRHRAFGYGMLLLRPPS